MEEEDVPLIEDLIPRWEMNLIEVLRGTPCHQAEVLTSLSQVGAGHRYGVAITTTDSLAPDEKAAFAKRERPDTLSLSEEPRGSNIVRFTFHSKQNKK